MSSSDLFKVTLNMIDHSKFVVKTTNPFSLKVSATLLDTQEKKIREGLIILGWTPPQHEWTITYTNSYMLVLKCTHCAQAYIKYPAQNLSEEECEEKEKIKPCYRKLPC